MRIPLVLFLALALVAACSPEQSPSTLPTTRVVIDTQRGPVAFTAEVASDPPSQEKGLMYRTELAPDAGMLFDFHSPQMLTFWMKNTKLPLDIIFISADGTIFTIAANAVPYSEAIIPSNGPERAVLEINGGRAAALGIAPGDQVRTAIFGNAP